MHPVAYRPALQTGLLNAVEDFSCLRRLEPLCDCISLELSYGTLVSKKLAAYLETPSQVMPGPGQGDKDHCR